MCSCLTEETEEPSGVSLLLALRIVLRSLADFHSTLITCIVAYQFCEIGRARHNKGHDLWFIVSMKFTEVTQQGQIGITSLQ